MKYEKLPENILKQIDGLKDYAQTIQSDVLYALESTKSLEEFHSHVENCMNEIISEAQKVAKFWAQGKGASPMVKKDIPPMIKGSDVKISI